MKKRLYTILDVKIEETMDVVTYPTDAAAIRAFVNTCQDPNHEFHRFSEDFTLWHVGFYSTHDMEIEKATPKQIARAIDCIKKETPNNA